MPVASTDIKFFKSTNGSSTGGTMSATEIVTGVLNNLFADIAEADRLAGIVVYRKFFMENQHGTDAMNEPKIWVSLPPVGLVLDMALGFNDADDDNTDAINMTAWSGSAVAAVISSGADTRTVTIYGINSATSLPDSELVTMNGTTEVLSTKSWSKVWGAKASAESGSVTITLKQGSGGTTRGTIAVNREMCSLWVAALSEATAIILPDLAASLEYGFWLRLTVDAGDSALKPGRALLTIKES